MKVKKGKLVIWLLALIFWCGAFLVADYSLGQHYGKNVATKQFDADTTAYKELRTQKSFENGLRLIGIAGGLFLVFKASTAFKFKKEE